MGLYQLACCSAALELGIDLAEDDRNQHRAFSSDVSQVPVAAGPHVLRT